MSRTTKTAEALQTMDKFITEVSGRMGKKAEEANLEKPAIGGTTDHPSKSVEDRTQDAKEGERSAENTADVKKDQPVGVDNRAEPSKTASGGIFDFASRFAVAKKAEGGAAATPGSAADDQLQIGLNKQPTGEDPSNETASAKGGKKDEGDTSHPARTDNNELAGGKYAADDPLEKLLGGFKEAGDRFVALLTHASQAPATAPATSQAAAPAKVAQTVSPEQVAIYGQAGYELAGLINGTMDKQAADVMVRNEIEGLVKTAAARAHRVADALDGYFAERQKKANGMPPEMAGGGGGAMPPAGPPGGGPGGPPPGPAGAAMPPPGGGAPGGEVDEQQILQMLIQAGIPEEEALALIHGEQGGGEGGGEGGASAGGPPGGGDPGAGSGGPAPADPKTASAKGKPSADPAVKQAALAYLSELITRSKNSRK